MAPVWATWTVPVIVSIVGESIDDFAALAGELDGVPGVSGLELNISCPNVAGGLDFGRDTKMAADLTAAVRERTTLPVLVKLTPNVGDIVAVAATVAESGADAVVLINTLIGMAVDIKRRRPVLANSTGGLSGPAIKPVALAMVYAVAQEVEVPIVGVGGIATAEDALEFILAGATAIEVGTATFRNPRAPVDVVDGLEAFLRREGVADLAELRGAALPPGSVPACEGAAVLLAFDSSVPAEQHCFVPLHLWAVGL
jgi:dihydroorotate dehydrogenase (NAD+) catalytic subunit